MLHNSDNIYLINYPRLGHESNDVLLNGEFSRERHLLGKWRLWENFLPEVTHLFLPNLCLGLFISVVCSCDFVIDICN